MFAKVTTQFSGRPDDAALPRQVLVGEVISGDLAAVAVREKWAEEVPPNEKSEVPAKSAMQLELEGKKVEDLVLLAKEKSIDLGDATKKADIIAALLKVLDVPAKAA